MTHLSDEEATTERVGKLGEEAGRFSSNLEKQLYSVRTLWKTYVGLFGTNLERVELINSVSGQTSIQIKRAMWQSAVLSICRMTDPVLGRRATHKNVTIQRLPSYLSAGPDSDLSDHITFAVERAKFAKLYRDKLIAHSDDDAMNGRVSVLQGSRADMREAMDAIATCIKRFALVELGTSLVTHPITKADDEVWFLQHLFEGVKAMESKKVRYQELLRAGRHAEAKALNSYPDWLNFRPKRITDVD